MNDTTTTDKLVIVYESTGAQQFAANANGAKKALEDIVVVSDKVEKSTGSVDGKFAALERRFGTAAGQAAQYEKIQKSVNDAVAANPALQSRANDILAAAGARYSVAGKAAEEVAKSTGLAAYQVQNLFRQLNDVATGLATGQSPLMIAGQQAGQIADVFQGGNVTARGFFDQIKNGAAAALTPMRLLAGGVLGVGAAALYLGNNWQEAAAEVDRALTGIGARSGTTAADIAKFTKANSSAAGLSIADARNAALEFAKTGEVAVGGLKGVGDAIRGYSLLTGKDATEATQAFAGALQGDLLKNLLTIDQRYGSLNASTYEYIRTLVDQGDKTKALQAYIDAIAPANKRAEESVGSLTKAWQGFKNVVSNIASGPAPTSLEDQIAGLQAQRNTAASTRSTGITPGGYLNTSAAFGGKSQELADLDRQIAELQKKLDALNAGSATAQLDELSKKALVATNSILPQIDAIRQLDQAIRDIEGAQAKGVAPSNADAALAVYKYQAALQQESLDTMVRQAQQAQVLVNTYGGVTNATAQTLNNLNAQLIVAQQVTGAAQMAAQADASRALLIAQGTSAYEAQALAAKQFELSQASATSNVMRQVEALKDSTAMIKAQQNGTEATTAAAIAYKDAIASGADETAAAAAQSATLANYAAKAASSYQQMAAAAAQAKFAAQDAADRASIDAANGTVNGVVTLESKKRWNDAKAVTSGKQYTSTSNVGQFITNWQRLYERIGDAPTLSQMIDSSIGSGVDAALSLAKGAAVGPQQVKKISVPGITTGPVPFSTWGLNDIIDRQALSQSQQISSVGNLYDLKNAKISDKAQQRANLQEELTWLQTLPVSLETMTAVNNLTQKIKDLTDATESNTDALNKVTLNPLYNGRDALSVGYYKAASGLDLIPQGPMSGDQIPFHAMVNGGERIQIKTVAQQRAEAAGNDNRRTIIQNITLPPAPTGSERRSQRQFAQGFGQVMASLS